MLKIIPWVTCQRFTKSIYVAYIVMRQKVSLGMIEVGSNFDDELKTKTWFQITSCLFYLVPVGFYIPIICSNWHFNCSIVLIGSVEFFGNKLKKTFCSKKCSDHAFTG